MARCGASKSTWAEPSGSGLTVAGADAYERELLDAFEIDAPVRLIGVGVASMAAEEDQPAEGPGGQQALSLGPES